MLALGRATFCPSSLLTWSCAQTNRSPVSIFGDRLRADLFVGLALRGAGAVSGFAFSWLISRFFGASTLGLLQVALVTSALAANFAGQGLDRILVREASIAFGRDEPSIAHDLFNIAIWRQFAVGGLLSFVVFALAGWFARAVTETAQAAPFLRVLAPAVLAMAVIRLCAALLRARGSVLVSQALDGVSYTGFATAALALAWTIGWRDPLSPAITYLGGVLLVAAIGLVLARHSSPVDKIASTAREKQHLSTLPGLKIALMVGMALCVDWIALLLLTSRFGPAEAGIYRVALQFCLLFTLVNSSFAMMAGPHIARAAAKGDSSALTLTLRKTAIAGVAVSLPVLALLLIFAKQALGFFGKEFEAGETALRIVALAQFANVAFGPVGESLIMMKREGRVLAIEAIALGAGLSAMAILLDPFGMTGVAIGTAIGILVRNALSALAAGRQIRRLVGSA